MIRPLRQRHRIMISTLSVIIPAAFALGIASRKQIPLSPDTRPTMTAESSDFTEVWDRNDLWKEKPVHTRLLRSANSQRFAIELAPDERIVRPDLLVYWIPGETQVQGSLPDNAFLLGSFEQSAPARFDLPDQSAKLKGILLLYSLADHEIVAVSKFVTF